MPNDIGLLAGDGPALRVWYADTTLRAHYYSAYRPRPDAERGTDLFFRFDTTQGLVPVLVGPAATPGEIAANPDWAHDHEVLAALFLEAGEIERALVEYRKMSDAFPEDPAYSLFCGVLLAALGRTDDAERLYDRASPHLGGDALTRQAASELLSDFRASWRHRRE